MREVICSVLRLNCVRIAFTSVPWGMNLSGQPIMSREHFAPEAHRHSPPHTDIPNADGSQGLEHLLAVAAEAGTALRSGGLLIMEHGWTQSTALQLSLKSHIWENIIAIKDLAGHNRLLLARRAAE